MYPTWTRSNNSKLKEIALKFEKDTNIHVKLATTNDDDRLRKRQRSARNMNQHKRKKSIEIADNANLVKKSVVTTPTVATEANVNEILVVGCSETDPLVCQLGIHVS